MSKHKIIVITDSSAYIPESALAGLQVPVIPLWLLWDGDELRDGVDILPATFYPRLRASQTLPTSSQPTVPEFIDFYQKVGLTADTIVSVLVSSKISGTIANAQAAVEKLPELDIRIVDSYNSSMGLGHVVLAAARAAAEGKTAEEVVRTAEQMRDKINFIFVVDTLEYLHKGGRIGKAQAMMGSLLSIKPIIGCVDGEVQPKGKARTRKKAMSRLLEMVQEHGDVKEVTVVNSTVPDEVAAFTEQISAFFPEDKIIQARIGPVIGTYLGPGSVAVGVMTA